MYIMKKEEKMIGIYMISFNSGELVYIGRATDIKSRLTKHKSDLKCGKHSNYKMQRAYDEFGNTMETSVLEECDSYEDSVVKEVLWINEFDSIKNGLNILEGGETVPKKYTQHKLYNPKGVEFITNNLAEFCREYKLDLSAITRVLSGERPQHKGWTKNIDKPYKALATHVEYGEVKLYNHQDSVDKYGGTTEGWCRLVTGRRKSYLGFKVRLN